MLTSDNMGLIIDLSTIYTVLSKKLDSNLGNIHGISFSEYMILFHLDKTKDKTMRRIDLAQKVGLTASGITRAIAPMEKIGLLEKKANERDARVSLISVSSAGERILKESTDTLERSLSVLFEDVDEQAITVLYKTIRSLSNNNARL